MMGDGTRRATALAAGILAAGALAACGQRGPLVLPQPPQMPAPRTAVPSAPTPPTVLSPAAPGARSGGPASTGQGDAAESAGTRLPR